MIEEIRTFIKNNCPLVSGGKVNTNYLGEKPMRYSVEAVPARPLIREYTDGGSLRQFVFVFASREVYDGDEIENQKAAEFYEDFSAWCEECTSQKVMPSFSDASVTPLRLEVLSGGYLMENDGRLARYQMQARLIFRKSR